MRGYEKTLTRAEYYQLTGLLLIGQQHYRKCREVEASIQELLGITGNDKGGHETDAIYSEYSADDLLGRMGISVGVDVEEVGGS